MMVARKCYLSIISESKSISMTIDEKIEELEELIAVLQAGNMNTETLEVELLVLEMKRFSDE